MASIMFGENKEELTAREKDVAELIAWGASKKEIASRLFISERTVENHTRSIYFKVGVTKANELSAWWFCNTFHISFDLSPLRRQLYAVIFCLMLIPNIFMKNDIVRVSRRATRVERTIRRRDNPSV